MARPDPAVPLLHHPLTPCAAVGAIVAGARHLLDGGLEIRFRLTGDLDRIRIPEARPTARRNELWRHTCCEAFVARPGNESYREFNFSPSGEWAAYAFRSYRQRDPVADPASAPSITVTRDGRVLELAAVLAPEALPAAGAETLELGLSMVVESAEGPCSFWALRHPRPQPDFHHRDAFAIELVGRRATTCPNGVG